MSDEYDVFKPEPKVAVKPKAEPEPRPANMDEAEFAALRKDIRRMWSPEPEETR